MSTISDRERRYLDAVSDSFERTWIIADRAGLSGPKDVATLASFLTGLADRGLVQRGGTRADTTWRRVDAPTNENGT